MNAPTKAAFQATYADWRLIKTRKCVQIVLEVPLEQADQAYAVLGGMPMPAAETWCAVARLVPQAEAAPDKPAAARKPVAPEKRLAQQAAIVCGEPAFWRFLEAEHNCQHIADKDDAAAALRSLCNVASRSEIVRGTPAGDAWDRLYGAYLAWERV